MERDTEHDRQMAHLTLSHLQETTFKFKDMGEAVQINNWLHSFTMKTPDTGTG